MRSTGRRASVVWVLLLLTLIFQFQAVGSSPAGGEPGIDLGAALASCARSGRYLAVYFGQEDCAYCERFVSVNLADPDIAALIRRHFVWIALDIHADLLVKTPEGESIGVHDWARREGTDYTPSVLFYDPQGRLVLRLRGYHPPYQFRAALDYVASGRDRSESFADYLARGDDRLVFDASDLNPQPFFSPPPHVLDRRLPGERPLAVFFERGDCHPCDLLHRRIRRSPELQRRLAELDAVQLDLYSETPLIAPDGRRLTARAWGAELGIPYAPAVVLFDESGRELARFNSVADLERLEEALAGLAPRTPVDARMGRVGEGDTNRPVPAPAVIMPSPESG